MRRLGEIGKAIGTALEVIGGAAVVLALLFGPMWILLQLPPPPPDDGLRYEPPPEPGALVETAYGPGVVVREVRYGDGPRWQVRLESGRHVVVYRAQMEVQR